MMISIEQFKILVYITSEVFEVHGPSSRRQWISMYLLNVQWILKNYILVSHWHCNEFYTLLFLQSLHTSVERVTTENMLPSVLDEP